MSEYSKVQRSVHPTEPSRHTAPDASPARTRAVVLSLAALLLASAASAQTQGPVQEQARREFSDFLSSTFAVFWGFPEVGLLAEMGGVGQVPHLAQGGYHAHYAGVLGVRGSSGSGVLGVRPI